jgi:UDP-N-acetyl-2-amino-2-deoxyglucuronate dehydrogenase
MSKGVGIIGAGKIGQIYLHSFSSHRECHIAALYNRTTDKAIPLAEKYGGHLYTDWRDLLAADDVELVGICTPADQHCEQTVLACEAGKHVLCEKPMAPSLAECDQMIAAARANGVTLMIGFQMRFHPVVRGADEVVQSLGQLYHLDFEFPLYRPGFNWRHRRLMLGGVLKEAGVHLLDLACHWLGKVAYVSAETGIAEAQREVEDYATVTLRFHTGAAARIYCSFFDRRPSAIKGNLIGERGQLLFSLSPYRPEDSRLTLLDDDGERPLPLEMPWPENIDPIYPGYLNSFDREIAYFVECANSGFTPITNGELGRQAVEIALAAYQSQRLGGKIPLPLEDFSTDNLDACFPRF